jgi:hypothetical protein
MAVQYMPGAKLFFREIQSMFQIANGSRCAVDIRNGTPGYFLSLQPLQCTQLLYSDTETVNGI